MLVIPVPADCICDEGTVFVRVFLGGEHAPQLAEACDVCGSESWKNDPADLEERAANILADRGT